MTNLELIEEYFKNTPRDQVLKDWSKTEKHDNYMKETIGVNENLNYLLNLSETYQAKYHKSENFILELSKLNWWGRLFMRRKIIKYFELEDYEF